MDGCSDEVEKFALDDGSFGCWFMVNGENFGSERRRSSLRGSFDYVEELYDTEEPADHIAGRKPEGGNAVRSDPACCGLVPTALFLNLDVLDDDIACLNDTIESLMSSLEDRSAFIGLSDKEKTSKTAEIKAQISAMMIRMDELECEASTYRRSNSDNVSSFSSSEDAE
uniref:Uncharacterized protein n=1 Tax=Cryptomonas curvata TaxID=233186 RepID=A0A6T7WYZ6_9CRYP